MEIRGLDQIQEEAGKLRHCWKSFQDLERLDLLDRMLDRYSGAEPVAAVSGYSRAPAPPDADFRTLAASVPVDGLIAVIADHMDILEQIYPRDYAHIMQRLRDL